MSSKSESQKSKPINPAQKDRYIRERLRYWRDLLGIDPKLKVSIKYQTNREDDDSQKWAAVIRDMMEYRHATLEIYDELVAANNFHMEAEAAICHEVLHLAIHPLIAFCHNMFEGDEGKRKELERLEEQTVTTLEEAFMEKKWQR